MPSPAPRRGTFVVAEPLLDRCSATTGRCSATLPGKDLSLVRYLRPFYLVDIAGQPTSWCWPTTSPSTTAPAWSTRPPRSAWTTSRCAGPTACRWSTRSSPTDTSRQGIPPGGRCVLQGRRRDAGQGPEQRGLMFRHAAATKHPLSALLALPHPADVLRAAVLVHPDHAIADELRRRTRKPTGTRSTSSTAATATGSTTTSTGRCRARATGAPPCRCGASRTATLTASGRGPNSAHSPAQICPHWTRIGRTWMSHLRLSRCRQTARTPGAPGHRRLVRLRFYAVRPVRLSACPGQSARSSSGPIRPSTSARPSTRPVAGSTP